MINRSGIGSKLELGMTMGNSMKETGGIVGEVTLECFASDGSLRWIETQKNLITTNGDNYYAKMGVAGVDSETAPANLVTGMAVGANTATAPTKTGAGSFIATADYTTGNGSHQALDAGGTAASGNVITYVVTFNPGEATMVIGEIALTTDSTANDTGGTQSSTVSRAQVSPTRDKQLGDTLVATWTHTFLGA